MAGLDIIEHNAAAWDRQALDNSPWSQPVAIEIINAARMGNFKVYLTPSPLPDAWLGDISGRDILCLASAGGQQAPVLAAAGANVTVFDLSREQLAKDIMVAGRDGLKISAVQGDMRDLSAFSDASFDLILHPISNQYVPDIQLVWNECFRVLRKGGSLLSSFFNPALFVAKREAMKEGEETIHLRYKIPYSDMTDLNVAELTLKQEHNEPLIFGHSLESQIGGQIKAGFVLAGFMEEAHPSPRFMLEKFVPSFIATRSLKL